MRPRFTAIAIAVILVAWIAAHAMTDFMRRDPRRALIDWPAFGLAWAVLATTNWKQGRRPATPRRRRRKKRRGG